MNKKFKILLYILISIVLFKILYYGINVILNKMGLSFRIWIDTAEVVFKALSIVLISLLLILILKDVENNKITFIFSTLFIVLLDIVLFGLLRIALAFNNPEHIVVRDNKKMIAEVNSFQDVFVYYYEYKNHIVRGNKLIIEEWYGNGGYDPFSNKYMNDRPTPRRTTYYDEDGNFIKEIYNKR